MVKWTRPRTWEHVTILPKTESQKVSSYDCVVEQKLTSRSANINLKLNYFGITNIPDTHTWAQVGPRILSTESLSHK